MPKGSIRHPELFLDAIENVPSRPRHPDIARRHNQLSRERIGPPLNRVGAASGQFATIFNVAKLSIIVTMQPIMAYLMRKSELPPFPRIIRINVDPYGFPVFLKNEPTDFALQWSKHDFQT